jgi:hypothetical protein
MPDDKILAPKTCLTEPPGLNMSNLVKLNSKEPTPFTSKLTSIDSTVKDIE